MTLRIKRIYEAPGSTDGYRVLVDGIWPRGISKEKAKLDEWLKTIAPSAELRTRYGHKEDCFIEFKKRYEQELKDNSVAIDHLKAIIKDHQSVTLLYAARASKISNAAVLLEYFNKN